MTPLTLYLRNKASSVTPTPPPRGHREQMHRAFNVPGGARGPGAATGQAEPSHARGNTQVQGWLFGVPTDDMSVPHWHPAALGRQQPSPQNPVTFLNQGLAQPQESLPTGKATPRYERPCLHRCLCALDPAHVAPSAQGRTLGSPTQPALGQALF